MDPKSLKTLLECPICFEVRRDTSIFQCGSGHVICAVCKRGVTICPTCRGPYDSPIRRSLQTEKLISECNFEFPCKFSGEGCNVVNFSSHLEVHEMECQFRKITCTFPTCNQVLCTKDFWSHAEFSHVKCQYDVDGCKFTGRDETLISHELSCDYRKVHCPHARCNRLVTAFNTLDHIRNSHRDVVWLKSNDSEISIHHELKTSISTMEPEINIVKFGVHSFALQLSRQEEDKLFFAWVAAIGDENVAEEYSVEIKIAGNGAESKKKCRVNPIDRERKDLMEDLDCFVVSERQLRQCVVNTGDKITIYLVYKFWRHQRNENPARYGTTQEENGVPLLTRPGATLECGASHEKHRGRDHLPRPDSTSNLAQPQMREMDQPWSRVPPPRPPSFLPRHPLQQATSPTRPSGQQLTTQLGMGQQRIRQHPQPQQQQQQQQQQQRQQQLEQQLRSSVQSISECKQQ